MGHLDHVLQMVGKVNGGAEVVTAAHSVVPVETLLDLHAYDGESERPDKFEEKGAHLDSAVGTVSLQVIGETSLAAAEEFLGKLLWETETHYPGTTVLRSVAPGITSREILERGQNCPTKWKLPRRHPSEQERR